MLDISFLGSEPDSEDDEDVDTFSARVGLVALRGTFSVASSNKLVSTISADIRDHEVVIFDFSDTEYIDDSVSLVVEYMIDVAHDQDTDCFVMGLKGAPAATLRALNVLKRVPSECYVDDLDGARETAKQILREREARLLPSHA